MHSSLPRYWSSDVCSSDLPFLSGAIFFFVAMVAALVFAIRFTHKKDYKLANTIVIGLIMILIGYGSFATITIRSAANPPLDENNPENLVTLHAFLKREQYGTWPILYGPYFNSRYAETSEFEDRSENYDRRWVVLSDRGSVITSFKEKSDAEKYLEEIRSEERRVGKECRYRWWKYQ